MILFSNVCWSDVLQLGGKDWCTMAGISLQGVDDLYGLQTVNLKFKKFVNSVKVVIYIQIGSYIINFLTVF